MATSETSIAKAAAPTKPVETKADAFKRLANARVGKALAAIEVIGNLASANYEYTEEQVQKIMDALDAECTALETKFKRPETAATKSFSL